ncbi:amino acid adenylation domain-containing protein [Pseudomonas sp. 21LCFQ010]|uniref:non-ribosomal peptide synthetase n=1 Tax=Pseudomonas sp. 21LCFQ010 TaxID=2957506 RepID=UPI002097C4BD|nr:non-ribosomal peptide synthetase [Pseudomonas sp. 21LCFQ010]MCO8165753.1 amino acid adenylation domain-containing protein [Pseudomonas sp. 21LCFQ010]
MQALLDSVKSLSTKERKALAILLKRQGVNLYGVAPILPRDPEETLALSYAQQRQWFLWQLEPHSTAYNMPIALRLKGDLKIQALRASFEALIERHEVLRTTFRLQGDQAVQVISPAFALTLTVEDLQVRDGDTPDERVAQCVESETQRPFNLETGPLLRVKLLRLADQDHVLVLTLHHIVSDGWSMPIIVDELIQAYEAFRTGEPLCLPVQPIQYADYAIWQRNLMEAGEQERQLAYWEQKLGGQQPVLELHADHPRPAIQSYAGANLRIELERHLVQRLKQLAQQQSSTLFMVLLASFQTVLHRYSGQDDIRVGVPIANRNRAEIESLIGFFVNTQVLKADFTLQMTFIELLQQVKQTVLEAQAHQDLPFERLVDALKSERSLSYNPLFQVMFNHQTTSSHATRGLPGLQVDRVLWEENTAQFDLSLSTVEHETGVTATLTYATDLFERSTSERLLVHWTHLLQDIVARPFGQLSELALLEPQERQKIIHEWNRTEAAYPAEYCLHHLIEQQVVRTPDKTALIFSGQSLSYDELNSRANRLACKLRELGVGPDVLVGICVERSSEMVVGLLAILKAGGAYVPLDPEYPQDRLAYMLEHSNAGLLLTQERLLDKLPTTRITTWCLDRDWPQLDGYCVDNPAVVLHPEHTAYCIYTSGSTGKPKGVTVPHKALVNFLFSMARDPGLTADDRVLALTSLSFDIAGLELYLPLLVGASVVLLADRENQDSQTLLRLIQTQAVTTVQATPTTWRMLLENAPPEALRDCRLLSGGEALAPDLASRLLERSEQVWNLYGPTETTIWSGLHRLDRHEPIPRLGKPIANTCLHIVEQGLNAAPVGVAGELLIGGAGLARGYLHRSDLTAERFVPDPFDASGQGGRLYRTGDLARYQVDGVIEYVSRIDDQVKIRGFRVELGEIEARLLEHPALREVVVIAIEGPSGRQLAAYLVAGPTVRDAQQQNLLRTQLREQLNAHLPNYMVPSYLLFMDRLPLTPNGKLDRRALPRPDASQQQQVYVAPQTALERQVAAIWADVLKLDKVGLTDNFFELGGHSLLATQVISRLRQVLNVELPLRTLFEASVLAEFVAMLTEGTASQAPAFEKVDRDQPLMLSFAQQRQWFLWQLEPDSAAYNMAIALRFKGVLDRAALQGSFDALIARHETLRTTFRQEGEQAIQIVHAEQALVIDYEALSSEVGVQVHIDAEIQKPFDLVCGPLLRVKLLGLAEQDHVLVLTLHHIVSDGWSMPLMVDELVSLYEGYSQGQTEVVLPALPVQYADYAAWQRNWMAAGEQARQLTYWTEQLGGDQPVLELPLDRPRPSVQSRVGASVELELNDNLALSLKQLAQQQGVTPFMVLLASFQTLLHRYSGQDDIRIGVPNANRNRIETERLIGFFVNTQVLKSEFDLHTTFNALLQQVKYTVLEAQAHQDLPFEQLVDALPLERSLSHSPLFQVMYNHQTQVKGSVRAIRGLMVEGLEWEDQSAKFDLTLNTFEHDGGFGASLNYATALFDVSTIQRLGRHWIQLLEQLVRHPEQQIAELPLLSANEYRQVVCEWNRTEVHYPAVQCIHQLIEEQVAKTPEATALVFGEHLLGYAELNRRANRLAHRLREQGVGPDVLVGIAVERSIEMVVGLLGILKAGGAYVPLDPEYPQDRLSYMMQDSGIRLLLTQSHLLEQLPVPDSVEVLSLDELAESLATCSDANPVNLGHPDNLAYVIYTSGSTGKPKGAGNSHKGLFNRLAWMQKAYRLGSSDTVLQKTPFSFDVSVWEFFWPLQTGACLAIAEPGVHREPERLIEAINRYEVTTLHFVPSMLQVFMGSEGVESCRSIRRIVCSGEALPGELARQSLHRLPQAGVFNLYGPTEAAIDVTHWTCGADEGAGVPIGRPIDNLKTHILAAGLLPAVQGCVGELYLGGVGLARGYHQRASLTAERFVPDPFDGSEQGGGRLYRTGDLACYRAEGVIHYLGRTDHQVKIRGLRIELGEIEAKLQEHAAIRESVVVDVEGPGGKQLAAYVVAAELEIEVAQQNDLRSRLREHLQTTLPDYMVPAHVVFLDKLPLSPNGKLDRKALPKPDASQQQQVYVAPQTELEQQIAGIWAEVLQIERVGLHDNFFELGGHSLLVLSVLSRVRLTFGVTLNPSSLFQNPVLEAFSRQFVQEDVDELEEKLKRLDMFAEELEEAQ